MVYAFGALRCHDPIDSQQFIYAVELSKQRLLRLFWRPQLWGWRFKRFKARQQLIRVTDKGQAGRCLAYILPGAPGQTSGRCRLTAQKVNIRSGCLNQSFQGNAFIASGTVPNGLEQFMHSKKKAGHSIIRWPVGGYR